MIDAREVLSQCSFGDWAFHVGAERDGRQFLQVRFIGPCSVTGNLELHHGRKWRLSPHMTKSEVVQTAMKAVLTAVEHEARERFRYRGQPIFGPHFDVDALAGLCAAGATDERTLSQGDVVRAKVGNL